jgi:hypothetical protein
LSATVVGRIFARHWPVHIPVLRTIHIAGGVLRTRRFPVHCAIVHAAVGAAIVHVPAMVLRAIYVAGGVLRTRRFAVHCAIVHVAIGSTIVHAAVLCSTGRDHVTTAEFSGPLRSRDGWTAMVHGRK